MGDKCTYLQSVEYSTRRALPVHQLALGETHHVALTSRGRVFEFAPSRDPQPIAYRSLEDHDATQVRAGRNHTLCLTSTGHVYWWDIYMSENKKGLPRRIKGALEHQRVTQIMLTPDMGYALTSEGEVYWWKYAIVGVRCHLQLEGPYTPQRMDLNEPIAELRQGTHAIYLITRSGSLFSWGSNRNFELGNTKRSLAFYDKPGHIQFPYRIATLEASTHVLAITDQGDLYAWGCNRHRQLGDGTTTDRRRRPVHVGGPLLDCRVAQVAAGNGCSLAMTETGEIFRWGRCGGETIITPQRIECPMGATRGVRICAQRGLSIFYVPHPLSRTTTSTLPPPTRSASELKRKASPILDQHSPAAGRKRAHHTEDDTDEEIVLTCELLKRGRTRTNQRKRIRWNIRETQAFIDDIQTHGPGDWVGTLARLPLSKANGRTPVDLKDKYRNLLKAGQLG